MAFEKFTMAGKSFAPKVSIWSKGQIGFNNGATSRFQINEFDFAILLFDKEQNKIGIQFTKDGNEEGIIKLNKRATGTSVGAKSFLDYYDIDYAETAQYDIELNKEENLENFYVIDLGTRKTTSKKDK